MENKRIGVGIIGAGAVGWASRSHIPALKSLSNEYEIVALSTTNIESARIAAKKFDVPYAFDNVNDLVNLPEVDLVVVAVKVPHHFELVKAAIEAGKMVYCEWPLGNGTDEAIELASLAAEKGVKTFTGLQGHSLPELKFLKDTIESGYIGEVLSISMIGSGMSWGAITPAERNAYLLDPKNGATMLNIPFGHTMDGFSYCLGEFKEISATLANRRKESIILSTQTIIPQLSDDQIAVTGILENGAVASIHYRGGSSKGANFLWEINGTKGDIVITGLSGHLQYGQIEIKAAKNEDQELKALQIPAHYFEPGEVSPGFTADFSYAIKNAYRLVYRDIRKGTNNVPDFATAVKLHRFLDSIEKAAETGCKQLL
jgi:predicted dehydrogenase